MAKRLRRAQALERERLGPQVQPLWQVPQVRQVQPVQQAPQARQAQPAKRHGSAGRRRRVATP